MLETHLNPHNMAAEKWCKVWNFGYLDNWLSEPTQTYLRKRFS